MTDDTDDIFAGIGPSGADGLDLRRTLEEWRDDPNIK